MPRAGSPRPRAVSAAVITACGVRRKCDASDAYATRSIARVVMRAASETAATRPGASPGRVVAVRVAGAGRVTARHGATGTIQPSTGVDCR